MIVVIQCAATKRPGAGHLVMPDGSPVVFVNHPDGVPASERYVYARPDDPTAWGTTWREELRAYNQIPEANPLGLYPAYRLYKNPVYGQLVEKFGVDRVCILSAGWGLITASFLTPYYDITFSQSAESYKRRRKPDVFYDFAMLPPNNEDEIIFVGGKDYLPLFCSLTASVRGQRTAYYNSDSPPEAEGCELVRFNTRMRTNWHYECAHYLLDKE